MIETAPTNVLALVPGDKFYMGEVSSRIEPREVIIPAPDIIRPTKDGNPVRDTAGKVVKIVRERGWLESCVDFGMIHVHTSRGVICVHRETSVERKV